MRRSPSVKAHFIDVVAAAVPASAGTWSGSLLGPLVDVPGSVAAAVAGTAIFIVAYVVMRVATPAGQTFQVATFAVHGSAARAELLLETLWDDGGELLLDQPLDPSLDAIAELILDDPLPVAAADSRVVRLFDAGRRPTAGELVRRIEHHRSPDVSVDWQVPDADASDALRLALDELRRSLRQG